MDAYLTTEEIAQRLNVKVETVRRWVRQGKLPGLPLGRAGYRIRQEDFDRFLKSQDTRHTLPEPTIPSNSTNNVNEAHIEAAATLILERMTDGIILFGLDGQCQYANEAACRLLSLAQDDLLGKTMAQVLPQSIADIQKSVGQNDYFSTATGRWYQLRTFATPQGRCISFLDITERKYQQLNTAFLADLTNAINHLSSPEEILQTVGTQTKQYFSVSSLTCAMVNEAANKFTVVYDSNEQNPISVSKIQRLSDFASDDFLREMKAGHIIAINNVATDPRTAAYPEDFAPHRVRAFMLASHVDNEQVDFVIGMQHSEPYQWRSDEIDLMQELIARIYPQLERVRAEQTLRESEEKYRTLFETMDEGFCIIEKVATATGEPSDFRYIEANPAFERHTGLHNVVGRTILEIVPQAEKSIMDRYDKVTQTNEPTRFEDYVAPLDLWMDAEAFPTQTAGRIAVLFTNTSERKRAEIALRDSEKQVQAERQRLYDLLMQAPAAIMVTKGPDHIYELLNPPAVQFLGVHRQYIGRPGREAVPEAVEQGFFELLDAVYQTGKPFIGNEIPARFVSKGDETLVQMYFNFVYQPSYNASGEIDGVLAYVNDVTETVLARKRIEESEERLRALANSMPQLAWSARADGVIDFFNERLHEYAEMPRNQDGIYEWQAIVHPDDRESIQRNWERATRTEIIFEHELRLHMKNGTYRWHLTRGVPVHDAGGSISRWYGTKTDIEQIKQLEQQKNDFIGVVSHELKTPVTSAKAFAEVLENRFHRARDEKSADLLAKMNAQMDKLTLLIGDLLDVTRIEAGKLQFREDFFVFDELVENIIEEVQRTTSHSIRREGATGTNVYGDRERNEDMFVEEDTSE